jgi:hypothetical protein
MRSNFVVLARAGGLVGSALVMLIGTASATGKPCTGAYAAPELERLLPRARLALSLPSTDAVAWETGDRCIRITVRSAGTGRLVRLLLRGVAVPRAAVQVDVALDRRPSGA